MTVLPDLLAALASGAVEVVDLHRAAVGPRRPILQLPPPFANTQAFALHEISRYDERGPAWYWNNISTGEHVGTHFDAPVALGHRPGRPRRLPGAGRRSSSAPAVVIDKSAECAAEPGLPAGDRARRGVAGRARAAARRRLAALPHRLGRPRRTTRRPSSTPTRPARTRRASRSQCARWLAEQPRSSALGVETVGTDAGAGAQLRPAVPVPLVLAGRRQVRPDAAAEPRAAAADGRGADRRAAADRRRLRQPGAGAGPGPAVTSVAAAVGRGAGLARRRATSSGCSGSGNFVVTNALRRAGAVVRGAAARGRRDHDGRRLRAGDRRGRRRARVHQGPGLTNALTGLTEAAKSRTPLLVLAADTAGAAIRSNFRIDQDELVPRSAPASSGCTARGSAAADAARAYRRAVVERRPVVLMMPLDVQAADRARTTPPCRPRRLPGSRPYARRRAPSRRWPTCSPGPRGRSSSPVAGAAWPAPASRWSSSPSGPARCSRPPPSPPGCSPGNPWALGISGGFASPTAAELIGRRRRRAGLRARR